MLISVPRHIEVLSLLVQAPFEFYLTGSQFFGYNKPGSDWDFFVGDDALGGASSGLVNWLQHNGFYKESNRDYIGATDITQIWKHGMVPVHIQVVEDAKTKSDVQNVLVSVLGKDMGTFSKKQRKLIWNVAIATFSSGEEKAARSVVDFRTRA